MEFKNRVSTYPGRVKITPVSGEPFFANMERADDPEEPGTPLNADTFNKMIAMLRTPVLDATIV